MMPKMKNQKEKTQPLYTPPPGLTVEEDKKLQRLSLIPTIIVMIPFLIKLAFNIKYQPTPTFWNYYVNFGLPFLVTTILTWMLSYEVSYSKKVRRKLRFHIIRSIGKLVQLIVFIPIFSLAVFMTDHFIIPYVSIAGIRLLCFSLILSLPTIAFFYKTRRFFRKFEMGEWPQ